MKLRQAALVPWSRNGNVRFKRRAGSKRAVYRASLYTLSKSRCPSFGSRQHKYIATGKMYEVLPGSETRASLTLLHQEYQGEPVCSQAREGRA